MCEGKDDKGNPTIVDRSGSCAIVLLIVGEMCYCANVGDSRAILGKLQATRSFQAGMQSVRQLEFALFDFRIHAEYAPGRGARLADAARRLPRVQFLAAGRRRPVPAHP